MGFASNLELKMGFASKLRVQMCLASNLWGTNRFCFHHKVSNASFVIKKQGLFVNEIICADKVPKKGMKEIFRCSL